MTYRSNIVGISSSAVSEFGIIWLVERTTYVIVVATVENSMFFTALLKMQTSL